VTSIGGGAFQNCSGLTSVTIPNSVTSIGGGAFQNCSGLTSVTIPNSVTKIEGSAFSGCSGLTSITIPSSVTTIGYGTFYGCSSLASVTIPSSVTSIGDVVFWGCSGLTSITIPSSVTTIGNEAFSSCSNLKYVNCYAENIPTTESNVFIGFDMANATLYVPQASVEAYRTTAPWSSFGVIEDIETKMLQCATPTINFVDGKLQFACETDDVEYVYSVSSPLSRVNNDSDKPLPKTYIVSVYATKDGYKDSGVASKEIEVGGSVGIKGDVNEDGNVNGTDIQEVINIIVNAE
jgi:hypothetical protein